MEDVGGTFVHRSYVVGFLVAVLVLAGTEVGWRRTLAWLVTGVVIAWAYEFSSTCNGFPFGLYDYHQEDFPDELWIGGVPFFSTLSFAFLSYFGFSLARTLLASLRRTGVEIQRVEPRGHATSLKVLILA